MPAALSSGPAAGSSTAAAEPAPSSPPKRAVKLKDMKYELYQRCIREKPIGHIFSMTELSTFGIGETDQQIMDLADMLVDTHDFILCKVNEGSEAMWKARSQEQAKILRNFTPNERAVYERVAEAGREGLWVRHIINRTRMHSNTVTKVIKDLTTKCFIKAMKSAKTPTRKMVILYELEPSEESTGGSFFTDGELDEGLIQVLCMMVLRFVEERSWVEVHHSKKRQRDESAAHGDTVAGATDSQPRKKKARCVPDDDPTAPKAPPPPAVAKAAPKPAPKPERPRYLQPRSQRNHIIVPRPSGYAHYPTVDEIVAELHRTDEYGKRFITVDVTAKDVEALLDMLVLDNRIERMSEGRYRSVRRSFERLPTQWGYMDEDREAGVGTGLTEAPCGRCPVFHLCDVGGPVGPENCEYFQDWLKLEW